MEGPVQQRPIWQRVAWICGRGRVQFPVPSTLSAFWYYRECVTRLLPGGFWWFMLYLIFGAIVGVLPWFAFLGTRKIVRDLWA